MTASRSLNETDTWEGKAPSAPISPQRNLPNAARTELRPSRTPNVRNGVTPPAPISPTRVTLPTRLGRSLGPPEHPTSGTASRRPHMSGPAILRPHPSHPNTICPARLGRSLALPRTFRVRVSSVVDWAIAIDFVYQFTVTRNRNRAANLPRLQRDHARRPQRRRSDADVSDRPLR